jgi:hypothetical protein
LGDRQDHRQLLFAEMSATELRTHEEEQCRADRQQYGLRQHTAPLKIQLPPLQRGRLGGNCGYLGTGMIADSLQSFCEKPVMLTQPAGGGVTPFASTLPVKMSVPLPAGAGDTNDTLSAALWSHVVHVRQHFSEITSGKQSAPELKYLTTAGVFRLVEMPSMNVEFMPPAYDMLAVPYTPASTDPGPAREQCTHDQPGHAPGGDRPSRPSLLTSGCGDMCTDTVVRTLLNEVEVVGLVCRHRA